MWTGIHTHDPVLENVLIKQLAATATIVVTTPVVVVTTTTASEKDYQNDYPKTAVVSVTKTSHTRAPPSLNANIYDS